MKINVLSSSYFDVCYKAAWHGNVYPFFHDSNYEFHYEVAKSFDRADEKTIDILCSLRYEYVDNRA
ncbi:hypothetical protein NAI02_11590, partial [Francisella tularensis subsp. holarctica]|nr:hypothetical protein [Francisella tularensis subsp. holarctica]